MNQNLLVIIAAISVVFVFFLMMVTVLSRYTKVGPNQVLVISGRRRLLPDGRVLGYRIVKGGGTFVFPVVEKVDVLSLEPLTVEMPRTRAHAAGGGVMEVDGVAQVKINSDDASIVLAAEWFLSKKPDEVKNIVRPVLEKNVAEVLGGSSIESILQNPATCAAAVQTAAAADMARMGLTLISVTLRNPCKA